ncbi:MAG: AbrB/MazE/SpoVT family DNA-binding domain-containing protein [Candidatus Promineifilaceae bacterium]|nr:AbrB/MazE/SpoVT family DNA-binding domain-containing protein [Candidatus Promineifilaceae bacterium]
MADTTRLSNKGQVIIPKHVRDAHRWQAGQELVIADTDDGIVLRPTDPFPATTLNEVAGSLGYKGSAKSIEEMDDAIRGGVAGRYDRG